MDKGAAKKAASSNWILWWRIDSSELSEQVLNYKTLGLRKSARGISVLCLLFSVIATIGMIAAGLMNSSAYVDAALFAVLALFIYFGHRWAMIAAMALWTFEKGFLIIVGVGAGTAHAGNPVLQIIWWCLYMHAFYLAFRVERARRRSPVSSHGTASGLRT